MPPRSRSADLTADLLHEIDDEATPPAEPASAAPAPTASAPTASAPTASAATASAGPNAPAAESAAPRVETALFLTPRGWSRPRLLRGAGTISLSAGPVRIRLATAPRAGR